MKHTFLTILLGSVLLASSIAGEVKTLPDELLRRGDSFEDVTLAQIYLALPQELFECSYQERIEGLISGRVQFIPDKHEIRYPGDGGQMSLTIRVTAQTREKLILHVTGESEGKVFYRLTRIPNGWKSRVTFPKEKKAAKQ